MFEDVVIVISLRCDEDCDENVFIEAVFVVKRLFCNIFSSVQNI